MFIFFSNFFGLIPYSFTVTSHIIVTFTMAITIFAIVLLFFPKGSDEYMRWWALLGTSVTFVVSMILFIDYLAMLDAFDIASGRKE